MQRKLYLIAGANGSGKTTLAHELLKEAKDLTFLNSDEIAKNIGDELGLQSGRILLKRLDDFLKDKKSVVLESTISGKYHEHVIKKFRAAKYEIIFIYVFLESIEQNIARIKQRVLLGGHNIPESDVRRRFGRSIANFWKVIKLADVWKLYYNAETSYELIARGSISDAKVINDDIYKKFNKVVNNG
jgi:predicted ABC-type ATPase